MGIFFLAVSMFPTKKYMALIMIFQNVKERKYGFLLMDMLI